MQKLSWPMSAGKDGRREHEKELPAQKVKIIYFPERSNIGFYRGLHLDDSKVILADVGWEG